MKIRDVIEVIETFAPLGLQEEFDNSGLNLGDYDAELTRALICFDLTEKVLDEAVAKSCNLIISHHPLTLSGLKHFRGETLSERIIARALRNGISLYASHTPLDSAEAGINARLGEWFGLKNAQRLKAIDTEGKTGLGIVGDLPQACSFDSWTEKVRAVLLPELIRHSEISSALREQPNLIRRVAFCGGSGGSLIEAARKAGADVFVCGDVKYHEFLEVGGMILMDVGHFETEHFGVQIIYDELRKKIPTFAGSISDNVINPIHYISYGNSKKAK